MTTTPTTTIFTFLQRGHQLAQHIVHLSDNVLGPTLLLPFLGEMDGEQWLREERYLGAQIWNGCSQRRMDSCHESLCRLYPCLRLSLSLSKNEEGKFFWKKTSSLQDSAPESETSSAAEGKRSTNGHAVNKCQFNEFMNALGWELWVGRWIVEGA